MASIATSAPMPAAGPSRIDLSTLPTESGAEVRPQAGPLPRKRGEIGYQEGVDGGPEGNEDGNENNVVSPLPARHPADRDVDLEAARTSSAGLPQPPNAPPSPASSSSDDISSVLKKAKRSGFLSWLAPLNRIKLGGVPLTIVFRLTFQLVFFTGTITVWVILARRMADSSGSQSSSQPNSDGGGGAFSGGAASIFVHVLFAIITLAQLLFLERTIFFVRAQRYAHMHHGASLPSTRRGSSPAGLGAGNSVGMAFAPWNRPSLPTYAATLAQSGVGTGDVEDNIIAIPPPPAYGNTRGSTLLLTGFLRDSLRAAVVHDNRRSGTGPDRLDSRASRASRLSRPVSYRSYDEDWEQRCDAERALYLADTLERLENNSQSQSSGGVAR